MAKRRPVELTIHIKEARDLAAPSDAKGNPVPLNSSVSFTLLNLAKEQTEVVADSTAPAYGFSTTLTVPPWATLIAAPVSDGRPAADDATADVAEPQEDADDGAGWLPFKLPGFFPWS